MHTENNRTIAALATPPGIGGLSVIRVSGDDALTIGDKIFTSVSGKQVTQADPYSILYGKIMDEDELIDTVTVSVFKAPNSYTGENTIEIGSHGGNIVYRRILSLLYKHGANPAEPGEFTKKAFINGKMDLTQVEAVADLIHAESEGGAKLAASQLTGSMKAKLSDVNQKLIRAAGLLELELDFSEEEAGFIDREELDQLLESSAAMCRELSVGYKSADILRSGLHVAIVGKPNVGKSTLFNALLGENRAITSNIAGTTRDYIKESLHISGSACYLYDTAGIRESTDTIEIAGIKLVDSVLEKSNVITILLDLTDELASSESFISAITAKYANQKKIYIVGTKSDLISQTESNSDEVDLVLSGLKGDGIAGFKAMLAAEIEQSIGKLGNTLVNSRQSQLLMEAEKFIKNAQELNRMGEGNELIGYEIRDAATELAWITGSRWSEQVLNKVFSGFCIGK